MEAGGLMNYRLPGTIGRIKQKKENSKKRKQVCSSLKGFMEFFGKKTLLSVT